ncbi:hypothetical protein FRC12_017602 [Ceratobasidium sp. 428]|nr:hypothetical protein FRC12_017602 [Ceratobasidium sp. 428]
MARRTSSIAQGLTSVLNNVVPLDAIPPYVPLQYPPRVAPPVALLSEKLVPFSFWFPLFGQADATVRDLGVQIV